MSKNTKQQIAFAILTLAALIVVIPTILIIGFIFVKGSSAVTWEFLTSMPRQGMRAGGIYPAIVGTLYLVTGTIIFALPLGIGSAIYLTEYAKKGRLNRIIRLAIVNLAGVPSVVYGLFGLGLFVLFLGFGSSILAGALTLACLILPTVITASEEALKSVPKSYREASLALGATKWQTIRHVVLPHAMPGILTGAILGIGRAAGETAPILLTVAAFFLPRLPRTVFDQAMALPYHLYIISTQVPNMPDDIKYATALVLLGIVGIFFTIATSIRIKFKMSNKA
ncbi:phosphate ABC transporter membrane protein 2, PhoT family [Alkalithermobacter thermoalcaliphilus JW-YL-7 = DSM 7308]|uniref:Phosphate transport system permease protein PstA n=1 Tax=Alkalithermobacter thermoalcaliphilus JW-YL-7 = DSM 7308 TaxID=1121328 RepID=A0A150FSW0_CLOPD|nr:phosphate ABC transporter, inner membrane subunit PstA [[Clostridium] paradoxum JW-YL-7 = DSM 7308]SHL34297.1 phosphate ABC transporter membrane protein 2, PhoT family [[Clostridium] paradoxum JW-YL-7 = DSM 7308]